MGKPRNVGDPVPLIQDMTPAERMAAWARESEESRQRHIDSAVKLLKEEGWRIVKLERRFDHRGATSGRFSIEEEL